VVVKNKNQKLKKRQNKKCSFSFCFCSLHTLWASKKDEKLHFLFLTFFVAFALCGRQKKQDSSFLNFKNIPSCILKISALHLADINGKKRALDIDHKISQNCIRVSNKK
jgi:hypothetical protein